MMGKWYRIGDAETALLGEHSWEFSFPDGTYELTVSATKQDDILVEFLGEIKNWHVHLKEQSGDLFKLSGMAVWTPRILETGCWFELVVGPKPEISYWIDRVIYRTDLAV